MATDGVLRVVEIKPATDGCGVFMHLRGAGPLWFNLEAQAISYAQEVFPRAEILVYESETLLKHRLPARTPP
jgi:hypothetical protein